MRKLNFFVVCLGILCCALQMQAQDSLMMGEARKMPREVPNPERIAQRETDRLKDVLDLTDKQYKKVYKLLLKEQQEMFENRMPFPPNRPGMGSFPPGGGNMPPMGEPGNLGNGAMGMPRPPMGMDGPKKETAEEIEKRIEKKNKKMKKILTESQYTQWLDMNKKPAPVVKKEKEEN